MISSENKAGGQRVEPLTGTVVVEVGGIGPGPFAGMVLTGMGAIVHRIERPGATDPPRQSALLHDRTVHQADLKDPAALAHIRNLIAKADALYEGFRPGVMERFGLGPDDCLALNPGLVYARMTGWGQHGPYAHSAGTTSTTWPSAAYSTPSGNHAAFLWRPSTTLPTTALGA